MLNHITIMGRLTRDPELRSTQTGVSVASFTVAVDRDYSGRNGGEKQTDFIDCVAWRQTGDFVSKYFHKGSMIVVCGSLQSRKWQDREGNNRTNWEINVDNVYFGESRREGGDTYSSERQSYRSEPARKEPAYNANSYSGPFSEMEDDGDLPF